MLFERNTGVLLAGKKNMVYQPYGSAFKSKKYCASRL